MHLTTSNVLYKIPFPWYNIKIRAVCSSDEQVIQPAYIRYVSQQAAAVKPALSWVVDAHGWNRCIASTSRTYFMKQ